jgi:hypothetical protein
MSDQTAAGWFNQFDPDILAVQGVKGNDQWCIRHWAPAPVFGANGVKAAILLLSAVVNLDEEPREPYCCQLGDQVMYDIWGKCPPERIEP